MAIGPYTHTTSLEAMKFASSVGCSYTLCSCT